MLAEARRQGVQRTLVTHATTAPVLMNVEQMKQATRLGAYIELVGGSVSPAAASRLDQLAETIRHVGPQFCILSSDLGRKGNPLPADGFAALLDAMRARGFTDQELGVMTRANPARVLGLSID